MPFVLLLKVVVMAIEIGSILAKSMGLTITSDHTSVASINLFVALLCACIIIGHLLEENRWMNESITALAIVSLSMCVYLYVYIYIYRSALYVFLSCIWMEN